MNRDDIESTYGPPAGEKQHKIHFTCPRPGCGAKRVVYAAWDCPPEMIDSLARSIQCDKCSRKKGNSR